MNLLVTGATGFVGGNLLKFLGEHNITVIGRNKPSTSYAVNYFNNDINEIVDFEPMLKGIDVVIHLAARAHIMNDSSENPLEEYRRINTHSTLRLARQAAKHGVKRFVFLSSIKVNGESTSDGDCFSNVSHYNPQDEYSISKAEAEEGLIRLMNESGMEIVIIRPPLVYGPGVKGNFLSMLNLVDKNLPLPFGAINDNKRSLVSVHNLVSLILHCLCKEEAANNIFLVSDGCDLSTAKMLRMLSYSFKSNMLLIPIPKATLNILGRLLNKSDVIKRLFGSLQLDISYTCDTLIWKPPCSVQEGFDKTVEYYIRSK